jgi:hypothetical protein
LRKEKEKAKLFSSFGWQRFAVGVLTLQYAKKCALIGMKV